MELTVVGCSGSASGPGSPASCYLVQAPYEGRTFSLVLDLGPGAFGALYRYLDPGTVAAIGLSHLHPDHCLDLCAFYVAAAYSPTAPWPRIEVYGPGATAERMTRAYEVPEPGAPPSGIRSHFDYRDWAPEQRIGPFLLTTAPVAHPVEAYAIRVREDVPGGRTLVYSGDSGPCPALLEVARGCDLLLVEASLLEAEDNPPDLHLTGRQAAELARQAGAGSVLLTHIPPWHDPHQVLAEASPHYAGTLALAHAGARWTLGSVVGPAR
jgi:ribonuclease BN (tRNA processing enzyme)